MEKEIKPLIYVKINEKKSLNNNEQDISYPILYEFPKSNILVASTTQSPKLTIRCTSLSNEKNNSTYIEKIADPKNSLMSTLKKGENILFLSFGKSGIGKTQTLLGCDSKFNEIEQGKNLINALYRNLKKGLKPEEENVNIFNIQMTEVRFDPNGDETIVDLLENCLIRNFLDLQAVAFKNEEQLNKILSIGEFNSSNFISNNKETRFISNKSHLIITLNMFSLKKKKNASFKLIDTLGFQPETEANNNGQQLNLWNLMGKLKSILDDSEKVKRLVKLNKENQVSFLNYFVSNFYISQTAFFNIIDPANDNWDNNGQILIKLSELSNFTYVPDKTFNPSPFKIISFETFYETNTAIKNEEEEASDHNQENHQEEEEGHESEKHEETEQDTNVNELLNSELKNIYSKINNLNAKINFSEIAEESDEGSRSSFPNRVSPNRNINSVERSKLRNSIDEEENENDLQSNPPQFEPHPSQDDFQLKERTNFSESAFDIYERKVKNILTSLYNYNPPEEPNLNDFALLKRNYDLLMTLFQEGEEIRTTLMLQFAELKDNLIEFKTEFDLRIQDEKLKNLNLQQKLRSSLSDPHSTHIQDSYEKELQDLKDTINTLTRENQALYSDFFENQENDQNNSHNTSVNNSVHNTKNKFQSKNSLQPTSSSLLMSMRNFLLKNNKILTAKLRDKEDECSELKKRERGIIAMEKIIAGLNRKNKDLSKEIGDREERERKKTEECRRLDGENEELRRRCVEVERKFKGLSEEFFKNKEQLFLFKEMAKTPDDYFPNQIRKNSPKEKRSPLEGSNKKMNKNEKEKLFDKLKSLIDY